MLAPAVTLGLWAIHIIIQTRVITMLGGIAIASALAIWLMVSLNRSGGPQRSEGIDENLKRAMARV
ncbi:hypothetical protein [Bradyrhizobium sp. 141]|uniref:hypothetical protein n=1 Tax=Bradyrhizobium sp. 141 TaxID=2782617 RepID=UPI001FF84AEA|nr:hypothetical protein [Bradyrhizobium sp. 141]MCK1720682.1 hypothetical protein [Bradyrhizobium sp. 141]